MSTLSDFDGELYAALAGVGSQSWQPMESALDFSRNALASAERGYALAVSPTLLERPSSNDALWGASALIVLAYRIPAINTEHNAFATVLGPAFAEMLSTPWWTDMGTVSALHSHPSEIESDRIGNVIVASASWIVVLT